MQWASSSLRELCVSPASGQQRTWPIRVGLLRLSTSADPHVEDHHPVLDRLSEQPGEDQHNAGDPNTARGDPVSPRLYGRRGTTHGEASQEMTASRTANSAMVLAPQAKGR